MNTKTKGTNNQATVTSKTISPELTANTKVSTPIHSAKKADQKTIQAPVDATAELNTLADMDAVKSEKKTKKKPFGEVKKESRAEKKQKKAEEAEKKAAEVLKEMSELTGSLKGYSWKELEVGKKFHKNEKLEFISRENVLITGCDVGSETNYIRAINHMGVELSKKPKSFRNDGAGFEAMFQEMLHLAQKHHKDCIVLVIEPTGHYWINLYRWMQAKNVTVLQVNPYAVKATKEIESNEQSKNDRKDPKLIADLAKNGHYSVPYVPDSVYAKLRTLSLFKDQLQEDRIREINRLQRLLKIHFPEFTTVFKDITQKSARLLLKTAPLPEDLVKLGEDGITQIWKEEHLRGGVYKRNRKILEAAESSCGYTDPECEEIVRQNFRFLVELIETFEKKLEELEEQFQSAILQVPNAEKLLEIKGLSFATVSGIVAQIGDISRFDNPKELQKLAGLAIVGNSSGKHKGESKISKRGRKRLRYWLVTAISPLLLHNEAFREYHSYYKTRENNPLKNRQADVTCASKLIRIIFTILKKGTTFQESKMLQDIAYPA